MDFLGCPVVKDLLCNAKHLQMAKVCSFARELRCHMPLSNYASMSQLEFTCCKYWACPPQIESPYDNEDHACHTKTQCRQINDK